MRILVVFLICAQFFGCGDRGKFNESDAKQLGVQIFTIHESHFGDDPSSVTPKSTESIPVGESLEFWAIPMIDGNAVASNYAGAYLENPVWSMNGTYVTDFATRINFDSAGIYSILFSATNTLGDTLKDSTTVFVDEPLVLKMNSPDQDLFAFDPVNDQINFQWNLTGIDSWEYPTITLYISADSSSVFEGRAFKTTSNSLQVKLENICPLDSNCRLWWKLVAATSTYLTGAPTGLDSSRTYLLQTRRYDTALSQAIISINAPSLSLSKYTWAKAHLKSDTIWKNWNLDTLSGIVSSPMLDPGIYTLAIGDSLHPEYLPESLSMELHPGSLYNPVDPIVLEDHIPPQVSVITSPSGYLPSEKDTLWFLIEDFGSGVDTTSLKLKFSNLDVIQSGKKIGVLWTKLTSALFSQPILVSASDKLGNTSAQCAWKLKSVSPNYATITGPQCSATPVIEGAEE